MTERCNFVVGQKVVCWRYPIKVNGTERPGRRLPRIGDTLTVGRIEAEGRYVWLIFKELDRLVYCDFRGFKPMDERKTDIGFAHEILRKVNDDAPVDAFENCSAWC